MAHALFKVNGKQFASLNLKQSLVIGRASDCEICVRDSKLSRRHLRLERSDEGWFAIDLNSSNGTLVEGEPIKRHRLEDGDLIEADPLSIVFHTVRPPTAEAADFARQIVIDPVDLAIEAGPEPAPPAIARTPEEIAAQARRSIKEAVNQREQEWAALATGTQTPTVQRKPLLAQLDHLPKPVGLTLVALTGLALFFVTFELSNWVSR